MGHTNLKFYNPQSCIKVWPWFVYLSVMGYIVSLISLVLPSFCNKHLKILFLLNQILYRNSPGSGSIETDDYKGIQVLYSDDLALTLCGRDPSPPHVFLNGCHEILFINYVCYHKKTRVYCNFTIQGTVIPAKFI